MHTISTPSLLVITMAAILLVAVVYWLGRSHGRQAERDDAWPDVPADDDQPAGVSGLITPKGAGGPAGGGRRR